MRISSSQKSFSYIPSEENIALLLSKRNYDKAFDKACYRFFNSIHNNHSYWNIGYVANYLLSQPDYYPSPVEIREVSEYATKYNISIVCSLPLMTQANPDGVSVGREFKVRYMNTYREFSFTIVPEGQFANLSKGQISRFSELSKAVIGAHVGDVVRFGGNIVKIIALN